LKFKCDLSKAMFGSWVQPTSKNGTEMLCSGITKLQNDSTSSRDEETNSNDT
jgi:hypothetical protein